MHWTGLWFICRTSSTDRQRIVIIGGGQAGLQAAISLRLEGHRGEITLIGDEPGLPYQRPPLSKAYLKTGDADALVLRPRSFFETKGITFQSRTRVDGIDRTRQRIHAGDVAWEYDHLILALGARNMRPSIDGIDHALDLRTLADAAAIRERLDRPQRIAVIGGGFIGLEFAAVTAAAGHTVTIAEAAPHLMARAVSQEISQRFLDKHRDLGVRVLLEARVNSVSPTGISLGSGQDIAADLVLLAAGVRPNTELAEVAGLAVDNGIAVDAMLRTSDLAISAIGDCASFPDPVSGQRVRLESVQAATDQARSVARRLVTGEATPYRAVAWFWSDQADWKLQIAGLAQRSDLAVPRGEQCVFRFRNDRLTAVETINDPKSHMRARKCFAAEAAPSHEALRAVDYDLALLNERLVG